MLNAKYLLVTSAALVMTAATAASIAVAPPARAAGSQLCKYNVAPVRGYMIQNNEWGSAARECLTTHGQAGFTVAISAIAKTTSGPPGGYPSIYAGCHWGLCASGVLAGAPQRVATLPPGRLITRFAATERARAGSAYNVAYDVWINRSPATGGRPDGTELMVWLDHKNHVRPAGKIIASSVTIGGRKYSVWHAKGRASGGTVTYELARPLASVAHLDLGRLIQDTVRRGYTSPLWFLISVEAGFEIWRGGAGLAVTQFGVYLSNSFLTP